MRLLIATVGLMLLAAAGRGADFQSAEKTDGTLKTCPTCAWQSAAKGMSEGRLCSLVLQVETGKTLDLLLPGGSRDAGWGKIGPAAVPLGTIGLPDAVPEKIERTGDWSAGRAVAAFSGGAKLVVHASQMSPGIAIETSTDTLRLFAGQHENFIDPNAKHGNWVVGFPGGQNHRSGPVTPGWAAVPADKGMKAAAVEQQSPLPPAHQAWMLLGRGEKTHFVRSDLPLAGQGRQSDAYRADCALLLVFSQAPSAVRVAHGGGLDFTFPSAGNRVAVLPLAGAKFLHADATQKWLTALPEEIEKHCRALADLARQYPIGVRQEFRYDATADEAVFSDAFQYMAIGSSGRKFAPLPPIAALARQEGMAITAEPEVVALSGLGGRELATEFGPVIGVAGADHITWKVKGLGKYVRGASLQLASSSTSAQTSHSKAPASLEEELTRRMAAMFEADMFRQWRPWTYVDNVPIAWTRGEYYWGEPGEVLALLANLHFVVGPEQQKPLLQGMRAIAEAYPPHKTPLIPADAGKPHGGYDPGPCMFSKVIAKERGGRVSIYSLYGLERLLALEGRKPTEETWQGCKAVVENAFIEQAWATLYLLGNPDHAYPWEKDKAQRAATPSWRGDRPAAVVNVNRAFAGAVGAVRLARLAGDARAEQQAWWLLARAAVARTAMGKLPGWRYKAGLCSLPKDPRWQWNLEAGTWHGNLQTPDWSKPEDDVRQVLGLEPAGVRLGDSAGTNGDLWQQEVTSQLPAFRYITPELAMLLRDHLKKETAALAARIELNQPTWYASFAEAILGAEHNMNHPSDAFEQFLARAWVLDAPPARLQQWIDVPWVDLGDLFYLNKLAETVRAYRAVLASSRP